MACVKGIDHIVKRDPETVRECKKITKIDNCFKSYKAGI